MLGPSPSKYAMSPLHRASCSAWLTSRSSGTYTCPLPGEPEPTTKAPQLGERGDLLLIEPLVPVGVHQPQDHRVTLGTRLAAPQVRDDVKVAYVAELLDRLADLLGLLGPVKAIFSPLRSLQNSCLYLPVLGLR